MSFLKNVFSGCWNKIADLILNHRLKLLSLIGLITLFMVYQITRLELSYELPKILPQTDDSFKLYEDFKKQFGEDGNVMVIAIESDKIYDLKTFNAWYDLNQSIKEINGVKNVLSTIATFSMGICIRLINAFIAGARLRSSKIKSNSILTKFIASSSTRPKSRFKPTEDLI